MDNSSTKTRTWLLRHCKQDWNSSGTTFSNISISFSRVTDSAQKENLGILIQYKVKIKLFLGSLGGELVAELPFTLMHPKPEAEPDRPSSSSGSHRSEVSSRENGGEAGAAAGAGANATDGAAAGEGGVLVDTNLIQLDT